MDAIRKIEAAPMDSYSPEDQAFYAFWYGHMLNELMQPPLSGVAQSDARYIWDAALVSKDAEIARLREALGLLLCSDPNIANATDDELSTAANDVTQDSLLRNQATAVLQARAALTQPTEQP